MLSSLSLSKRKSFVSFFNLHTAKRLVFHVSFSEAQLCLGTPQVKEVLRVQPRWPGHLFLGTGAEGVSTIPQKGNTYIRSAYYWSVVLRVP